MSDPHRFEETQRFRSPWLWAVLLLAAAPLWVVFGIQVIGGRPIGSPPAPNAALWAFFLLLGVGLPLFFWWLRLRVTVTEEALVIRFRPFPTKTIAHGDIESATATTYRPIRQFGGWGLRYGPDFGWVYSVSGTKGVAVTLTDQRRLMIGSQRAEALAQALGKANVSDTYYSCSVS